MLPIKDVSSRPMADQNLLSSMDQMMMDGMLSVETGREEGGDSSFCWKMDERRSAGYKGDVAGILSAMAEGNQGIAKEKGRRFECKDETSLIIRADMLVMKEPGKWNGVLIGSRGRGDVLGKLWTLMGV